VLCRIRAAVFTAVALTAACSQAPPKRVAPPPKLPEAKLRTQPPPPPEWYWEAVEPDVKPGARTQHPIDLPLQDGALGRREGAARIWDDLPAEARERLGRDGLLVVGTEGPLDARARSMGAFYTDLREQRIPHVVTMDALFSVVHVGIERALADIEERELAPTLTSLLEKLEARLDKEEGSVGTELAEAYRIARGVMAVARAISATPTTPYAPPHDLERIVAAERGNVEGHAGMAMSPLLGVRIDYTDFATPSSAARPGHYRALAWLGTAPLTLVGRGEVPGAPVDVQKARTNARAAIFLARLCAADVDPAINATYMRLLRLISFVWGTPDDLSLAALDALAQGIGVDLTKPSTISNVVLVDKVRARAIAGRPPAVYDGAGAVGRAGVDVRVFGGHASGDAIAMQALVGAAVGAPREGSDAPDAVRVRDGRRVLPSSLDVAAWLGAPEARSVLHEAHVDAFEGYDAELSNLERTRAPNKLSTLHASVHGSLFDALGAWAGTTASDDATAQTSGLGRCRLESVLAAWALVRHTGQPFTRAKPSTTTPSAELRISGAPLPVFVEPLPAVVARLLATMKQLRRGLDALAPSASGPTSATAVLVEIEDVLGTALRGAERHFNDEPLSAEEGAAIASLPARLARLEEASDVGPVVSVVYSDPPSRRVLASATGRIEPVLMLAREAGKPEPLLVVGAHLAHHELVEGSEAKPGVIHAVRPVLTDASWRTRLDGGPPPRPDWVSTFRWSKTASSTDGAGARRDKGPDAGEVARKGESR
jgi:hypothetical protein